MSRPSCPFTLPPHLPLSPAIGCLGGGGFSAEADTEGAVTQRQDLPERRVWVVGAPPSLPHGGITDISFNSQWIGSGMVQGQMEMSKSCDIPAFYRGPL